MTAGLVAYVSPERPQLALGPTVVRGLDLAELGVGDLARAERGDVLLIPGGGAAAAPPVTGTGITHRIGTVGELRCNLRF